MATFALVHGAWHGAWCWELLSPFLRRPGHDVVALDLPCDDGSASFDTYADVVCDALEGCNDDVVVVGHSLAGNTGPLVAARRPVRHLVYLCALIPDIGRSVFDQLRDEPMLNPAYVKGLSEPDTQNRTTWVDLKLARELLFADCDEPTAEAAVNRLGPQARYPFCAVLAGRVSHGCLHFRYMQRGPDRPPGVVEANCSRQAWRRRQRASRESFTVPFKTVSCCRRAAAYS